VWLRIVVRGCFGLSHFMRQFISLFLGQVYLFLVQGLLQKNKMIIVELRKKDASLFQ
jgi:hypothetical protein